MEHSPTPMHIHDKYPETYRPDHYENQFGVGYDHRKMVNALERNEPLISIDNNRQTIGYDGTNRENYNASLGELCEVAA